MPWRIAPAWPALPPPATVTMMSNRSAVSVSSRGCLMTILQHFVREVLVEGAAVDLDLAGAGPQEDARRRGLAPAGAVVLDLAHAIISSTGLHLATPATSSAAGFWAWCGCSAPA